MLLLILLLPVAAPSLAEGAENELDEWTVLFYFCGSDLESKYGYASDNLAEISQVRYPDNYLPVMAEPYGVKVEEPSAPGRVNILIETGGSHEWRTGERHLGMNVDPEALQRWRYSYYPYGGRDTDGPYDGFELLETLTLQSMADPVTLSDFIRWGTQTCPAKKTALVLWSHGGGARTGLFIDELFDNDTLYLYELRQSLSEAGVHFEAVVIDACLMANLETAWSLREYADWMVASEETVPGKGTALDAWLQALVNNPGCDGRQLGRIVCDETAIKYANLEDEQSQSILTWSVIDLSKVDALVDCWSRFLEQMNDSLRLYPNVLTVYARYLADAEEYGNGADDMRELGDLAYNSSLFNFVDAGVLNGLANALSDAVTYSTHGSGRVGARGLSFYYPMDFDTDSLDLYAMNFPLAEYLAYLEAVLPWTAPDWVHESVEPVPDIDTIPEFTITVEKRFCADGMPALNLKDSAFIVDRVYYRLYRLNEESGDVVRLGRTNCTIEVAEQDSDYVVLQRARDPLHWPSVDGVLFCMDMIELRGNTKLYNVPVQIDSRNSVLRCGRTVGYNTDESGEVVDLNDYVIYGLWEGYDINSELLNRSVLPLPKLSGQEYRFLYPVDGSEKDGKVRYQVSQPLTMNRAPYVEEIPLPAGTYYLEYEVVDVFMRSTIMDRIEFKWDGENMTLSQDDAWMD